MNKKLKIASAAVAVVMAGTMAFGMFGCNGGGDDSDSKSFSSTGGSVNVGTDSNAATVVNAVKNNLNFSNYIAKCDEGYERLTTKQWVAGASSQTKKEVGTLSSSDSVTLNFNIGDAHNRSISYLASAGMLTGTVTLPDGSQVSEGDLKPVWQDIKAQLSTNLNGATVNFTDGFRVTNADKGESKEKVTVAVETDHNLNTYDLITDGVTSFTKYQDSLLDLSLYMDEMPNYKAFLDANPAVKDSLTFNGGSMYYAPYFDGYNDVEKYTLFKNNWVESLLNATSGDTTQTWAAAMSAKSKTSTETSVTSYMGKTGSWNTAVLDKDGKKVSGGITINYDKALAAATNESEPLGAAIKAAAGEAYTGESGNIVDLMNFAINTKQGNVTGAQLLKIMQEYIKVTYYEGTGDVSFYNRTGYKLSDVFNGVNAAWDVDLFAALGRVMITNPTLLKSGSAGNTVGGESATALKDVYLVNARQYGMQRGADMVSWIGELYGVRGLESRYAYAYLDNDGVWQDARGEEAGYRAAAEFHKLYDEGLVFINDSSPDGKDAKHSFYSEGTIESMAMHDYLNTQTPAGFKLSNDTNDSKYNLEPGYNYTANLTAVSMWDENGNGAIESGEYFRFTESWRSVKDTGVAVPLGAVSSNPKKLKAVLEFIDFIFSEDGQIMMAYGDIADNANGDGGFWYNPEVPAGTTPAADGSVTVGGTTYKGTFTYKGKTYASNTYYGKRYNPTLTTDTYNAYVGKTVRGMSYDGQGGTQSSKWSAAYVRNYTDFARGVMGSALNFGNKLTSLEYQMTCQMGRAGAEKVDVAVQADVIRHVTTQSNTYTFKSPWYSVVPSALPFTSDETGEDSTLNKNCTDLNNKGSKDTVFTISSSTSTNIYFEIIQYGYNYSSYIKAIRDKLGLGN